MIETCRYLRPGVLKNIGKEVSQLISTWILKNFIFTVNVIVDHRKPVMTSQKGRV